jgi:TonB family protein
MRSFGGVEAGVSTFGEAAPSDVRFGDFTALNTDRNLFYSFYARMEEKIRHRWVDYARAAIYNLPSDPRRQTGKDAWVTKLEVVLDREGRFVRAILHESSGIGSLDSAPVQAFKEAHQFPNPPLDLVKSDGTIRIYYAFNVYQ